MTTFRSLLLLAIITLSSRGGVLLSPQGNAGPSSVEEDVRRPFCKEIPLGPSARAYHFHTRTGWERDANLASDQPKARVVMDAMRARGSFTAVVMPAGLNRMSMAGTDRGCKHVMDLIREECARPDLGIDSPSGSSHLFCTGVYFVQPWEDFKGLRLDLDQPPLAEEDVRKITLLPVGPSSLNPISPVMPAKCQLKYYAKLTGDDGSFLHSAPNLRTPIPHDPYPPELRYFESDMPPHHERVRTIYTQLPGKGLSTSNQPNERLALVTLPDRTRVLVAYTSVRADGLRAHELRHLLDIFLRQYLPGGPSVADAAEAVNLDGGASIFIAWYGRGEGLQVLAEGNTGGVLEPPHRPRGEEYFRFRPMGSMLKFELKRCGRPP